MEVNNAEANYKGAVDGQPWKGAAMEVNDAEGNYKEVAARDRRVPPRPGESGRAVESRTQLTSGEIGVGRS